MPFRSREERRQFLDDRKIQKSLIKLEHHAARTAGEVDEIKKGKRLRPTRLKGLKIDMIGSVRNRRKPSTRPDGFEKSKL